jgi:hypothetical protein
VNTQSSVFCISGAFPGSELQHIMAQSSNSEETLNHDRNNGQVGNDYENRQADGGERGEKKPEEQGPVRFCYS